MSNKITAADTYVAEIAETQWGKNPFWDATSYREFVGKGATNVKAGPSIVYSGYVDTGQKKWRSSTAGSMRRDNLWMLRVIC